MTSSYGPGDIAIIGMGCVLPKAPDLATYWQNIVDKRLAISDPPPDRLIDDVFDEAADANDRIYCRRGGYIDDLTDFNPLDYGIMPVSIEGAEPEHFMALKVADAALKDAGFGELPFNRERFEVILGRGTFVNRGYVNLLQHGLVVDQTLALLRQIHPDIDDATLAELKTGLKDSLPPFTNETAPGLASSVMTGIIANRMDLRGRTYTVDAACASALIALENAVQDLADGRCDAALVGAVQISTPAVIHMLFTQLGALSRHDALKPFDRETDGTMLGEGLGMVVLKRAEDAIRDGHRIYAVVRGVGSSSDGKAKGLLAPRPEGEEMAVRRAYEYAAVEPGTIGLVEAHGTGLRLGDATEIGTLCNVFGDAASADSIALGSVKSMIGHLIPAAGIASLIKTTLALYHRTLPPTLGVEQPNDDLGAGKTPFYLNTETRPWIHGSTDAPRRAAMNAFGFGGINAHAILEESPQPSATSARLDRNRDAELILLAGSDRAALVDECRLLLAFVERETGAALVDIAYSAWRRAADRCNTGARLAVVATDVADMAKKLSGAVKSLADTDKSKINNRKGVFFNDSPLARDGKLALMFPGEGSQYVNMLKELSLTFPLVQESFDLLDRAFIGHHRGYLPSEFIFPPPLSDQQTAEERMFNMDGAVDAVVSASRGLFRLIGALGIRADVIVGHSSGEIMALEAAGAFDVTDDDELVRLIREGNLAIDALKVAENIPEGQLMAVGGVERTDIDEIVSQAEGRLVLAMENCPHQFVLCGKEADIQAFMPELAKRGALCQPLPFSRAYHTSFFEPAVAPLAAFFHKVSIRKPDTPLYSCMSADTFPGDPEAIRELAVLQWARPVLFTRTIEKMYEDGARVFLEVGPRSNLTGFARDILKDKPALAVALNSQRQPELRQFYLALAQVFAEGVDMNIDLLFDSRQPILLDLEDTTAPKPAKPASQKLKLGLPLLALQEQQARQIGERLSPAQPTGPAPAVPATATAPVAEAGPEGPGPSRATPTADFAPAQAPAATLAPVSPVDADTQVMQQYLDTMNTFLAVQQGTMANLLSGTPGQASGHWGTGATEPQVIGEQGNGAAVTRQVISLATHPFLADHTLGGRVSSYDPQLLALPVVPMAFIIDLMAQAAERLFSSGELSRISGVRLRDWLLLERDAGVTLQTSVQASGPGAAAVELQVLDERGARTIASCSCEFRTGDNAGAEPGQPDIGAPVAIGLRREDFYPRHLFHGASLQAVESIDAMGIAGNHCTLRFPGDTSGNNLPGVRTIALDAIGQTVALWLANQFDRNIVAFPVAIDSIEFTGALPAPGETTHSLTQTRDLEGRTVQADSLHVKSDAVLRDNAGNCRLVVRGLHHQRIPMPNLFHDFRGSRQVRLTERHDRVQPGASATLQCRSATRIDPTFWATDEGIWEKVLAYIILSRQEREQWQAWRDDSARRDWLLRLLAVKEAVVEYLKDNHALGVCCADIEVTLGQDGTVNPGGAWLSASVPAPWTVLGKTRTANGVQVDTAYACSDPQDIVAPRAQAGGGAPGMELNAPMPEP